MNRNRKLSAWLTGGATAIAAAAVLTLQSGVAAHSHGHDDKKYDKPTKDLIETATGEKMGDVSTLVAAIVAADLVEPLKGEGLFTVFAPVNAAFEKLPEGTVETLLEPENKEQLQAILLYHVHAGAAIKAKDVKSMSLSTLNGKSLKIEVTDEGVMVNNAKVIKTDIVASNGVIHWIDSVVLPE